MADVEFRMTEDGRHFEWWHQCTPNHVHPEPGGKWWHTMPLAPEGWAVVQTEPLTVTPSLLCLECGTHGFITNGAWQPA